MDDCFQGRPFEAQEHLSGKYQENHEMAGDLEVSYVVLPRSFKPEIPYFVLQYGEPDTKRMIGIADSVPENLRRYAAAHEVIKLQSREFLRKKIGPELSSTWTEMEVLKRIPAMDFKAQDDYIQMRWIFFKACMRVTAHIQKRKKEALNRHFVRWKCWHETGNDHFFSSLIFR